MDREITKQQIGSVVALLVAGKVPYDVAQGFIDKYRDVPSKKKRRCLITVPALSAAELINLAQEKLGLTYLDEMLATWDFYKNRKGEVVDIGGKTYEVRSWKPGREVVPATEVREHFTDGFVGNTPAFIALMTRDNPEGAHTSLPEVARLFWKKNGFLGAPRFIHDENRCELGLEGDIPDGRHGPMCFWAFREVQS